MLRPEHPSYPRRLFEDPQAPAVLFCLGDVAALNGGATAALVGTRAPTRYGIGVAAQFGADLSAAGVSVVSGLALGIDGAAHEGACGAGAPPIGVVAGGLDQPYPSQHARLWERVVEHGVIVSESPAGVRTQKWRFPVRNRLMAALSDVVVVVESRHHGGSRHTVDAALARGIEVGAVPGSIRSADLRGHERAAGRRRLPGVLVGRHLDGAVTGGRRRDGASGCGLAQPAGAAPAVIGARPPGLRRVDVRSGVTGHAGSGHRARLPGPLRRLGALGQGGARP